MPEGTSSPSAPAFPQTVRRRFLRNLTICAGVFLLLLLLDRPVYEWFHGHFNHVKRPVPTYLRVPTRIMRSMEDWGENVYILLVAFAIWQLDRRRRSRVLCILVAAVIVSLAVEGVKRVTGRERPEISNGLTVWHGPDRWAAGGDYQSFPSGHTAAAAAYSGALSAFYPPLRGACIALAVGCGGNRIWKERHFLSDCWIGGAFGFWFAFTLPRRRWIQPALAWFDRRFSVVPSLPVVSADLMAGDSAVDAAVGQKPNMLGGKAPNKPERRVA